MNTLLHAILISTFALYIIYYLYYLRDPCWLEKMEVNYQKYRAEKLILQNRIKEIQYLQSLNITTVAEYEILDNSDQNLENFELIGKRQRDASASLEKISYILGYRNPNSPTIDIGRPFRITKHIIRHYFPYLHKASLRVTW